MDGDADGHFSKEHIQTVNRCMKRYSTLVTIREIQIKTTMRCHHTLFRAAIIKKIRDNNTWWRCEERELLYTVNENKLVHYGTFWIWKLFKKLKFFGPWSQPHFWIYIQRKWNHDLKEIPALPRSLWHFEIAKMWKQAKSSLTGEMLSDGILVVVV